MAYFPLVGRLDCGSTPAEHRGYWEAYGYGIMSIYKSDWDRFGGKCNFLLLSLEVVVVIEGQLVEMTQLTKSLS